MTSPNLDPDIIRVLMSAGVLPELATDHQVALADTMLARADNNIKLAAIYMRNYMKGPAK